MRKKGCYHKNRPFRLLAAAALRFVRSYLNDIAFIMHISHQLLRYFKQVSKQNLATGRAFLIDVYQIIGL